MYFWLAAFVALAALEAATVNLVSIWFAVGALAALIAAALGAPLWLQVTVFILASALSLALTRPLARRFLARRRVPTNADRVLGQTAKVTEAIDNDDARGAVYADGKTWTARSADGNPIPAGVRVRVLRMEGVTLLVEPAERPAGSNV